MIRMLAASRPLTLALIAQIAACGGDGGDGGDSTSTDTTGDVSAGTSSTTATSTSSGTGTGTGSGTTSSSTGSSSTSSSGETSGETSSGSEESSTSSGSTGEGTGATTYGTDGTGSTSSDEGSTTAETEGSTSDGTTTGSTSSGDEAGETTTTGDDSSSTTGEPGLCGDGNVDDGEFCDDGDNLGEELGDCAPGCEMEVEQKLIRISTMPADGSLGSAASADSLCMEGYKAMVADAFTRIPPGLQGEGGINWVLRPWTRYVTWHIVDNPLVWQTRDVALLGVDEGLFVGLDGRIHGNEAVAPDVWTGFDQDGDLMLTCQSWGSDVYTQLGTIGDSYALDDAYVSNGSRQCDDDAYVYCVEQ